MSTIFCKEWEAIKPIPIVTKPFARVAMDLVGQLSLPSSDCHRYVLTLTDFATRFLEVVPLSDIDSIAVDEAVLLISSRVGIPLNIISDRGTRFTTSSMKERHKLLGMKPIFTTPFHPSKNGRVKKLHSPLKANPRKLCAEKPRECHRSLIPSDRTGFFILSISLWSVSQRTSLRN